jgi:hypothetical protein
MASGLVSGCALRNIVNPPVVEGFIFGNLVSGTISNVEVKVPNTKPAAGFCFSVALSGKCPEIKEAVTNLTF